MSQSPTKTAASLRRITRHLTISRAERTAYLSSAVAVALTVLMVGSGRVAESNPGSAWLIETVGLQAWALSTPLALYLVFALYRFTARREHELTRVVAWATAGAVTLDAVGNLAATAYLGGVGSSVSLVVPSGVLTLACLLAFRRELADCSSTLPTPSASSVRTVGFAALIVVSAIAAPVSFDASPVRNASAASDGYSDRSTFEDNTSENWGGGGLIENYGANGSYSISTHSEGSGNPWTHSASIDSTDGLEMEGIFRMRDGGGLKFGDRFGLEGNYVNSAYRLQLFKNNSSGTRTTKTIRQTSSQWYNYILKKENDTLYFKEWQYGDSEPSSWTATMDVSGSEYDTSNSWQLTSAGTSQGTDLDESTIYEDPTNPVSGTVTDADGNALSGATVKTGTGKSTTTASDGSYSLSLQDGSYNITADASGYLPQTNSVTVSGAAVTGNNYSLTQRGVSGTVTDQTGAPVANATVRVAAVNYSDSSISDSTDARQYLNDLVPDVPQNLSQQRTGGFELTGPAGFAEQQDTNVGFVHSRDDLNAGQLSVLPDNADLTNPMWEGIPAQKRMMVTCLDPTETGGLAGTGFGQNEYDRQLPGTFQRDCNVEFTQLAGVDDVGTVTVGMDKTSQSNDLDPSKLPYGTVSLPAGWYRVQTSTGDGSYVIQVGDPTRAIYEELKNQQGTDVPSVAEVKDGQTNNKFEMKTTTTDANGKFSLQLSNSNLKTVGIQAYKHPGSSIDPTNLRLSDIRADANSNNLNQSVYLPSKVYKRDVPASGIQVRMTEASWSTYGNLSSFQDRWRALLDAIQNGSWSNLPPAMQQRLDNVSRNSLEETFTEMDELRKRNARLEDAYERAIARDGGDTTVEVDPDSASRDELERRVRALQQSMTELQSSIESGETAVSQTNNTVSLSFPFDADLGEADALVRVHYSNGTTRTLNTSGEYVSIETNALGNDVVKITDYPLGEGDAAVADFEVDVATADGTGGASEGVQNPAFNGNVPSLAAVEFSTLRPGPEETVSVNLEPERGTEFGSLTGAAVYGPGGTEIATTNKPNDAFEFTTAGHGVHRLELTFTNHGGTEFVEVVTLNAGPKNQNWPASIRTTSGPTGVYALVGDESNTVRSGTVEVRDGGSAVDVTAIVGGSDDVPTDLHVYTAGIHTATDSTTTVEIRRQDGELVEKNVLVTLHGPAIADNALVYRNGDPLPREGSAYGSVDARSNKTVYEVITDANGEVALRVSSDPGLIERARYWVSTSIPFDVPSLLTFPAGGAASAGSLLLSVGLLAGWVARRRR